MKGFYILFVVLTALSCCLNLALAQNEADWMPDENLRAAVRQALNINSDSSFNAAGNARTNYIECWKQ